MSAITDQRIVIIIISFDWGCSYLAQIMSLCAFVLYVLHALSLPVFVWDAVNSKLQTCSRIMLHCQTYTNTQTSSNYTGDTVSGDDTWP